MDDGNKISNIIPAKLRELMLEEQTAMKDVQAFKVIEKVEAESSKH